MKTSPGKISLPGKCQVWRREGFQDLIALDEEVWDGRKLLRRVMAAGERLIPPLDLARRRAEVCETLFSLPPELSDLTPVENPTYPVQFSSSVQRLIASSAEFS